MEEERLDTQIPEEEIIDTPEEETPAEEKRPAYVPRPKWQIVLAWIGIGIMVVSILLYYWQIASGGF